MHCRSKSGLSKNKDTHPSPQLSLKLSEEKTHLKKKPISHRSESRRRDRVQRWTDLGSVTLILFLSSSVCVFLLSPLLATRSDDSEPPSSPLSSTTLRLSSLSFDLVLLGGVLLDALGGSSPQRTLSILSACLGLSNGHRDLPRLWMCGGHRVWRVIPGRISFDSPIFGVDYSKLFMWKSPYHTRIGWKIRFDFTVVCLARSKVSNLLLFWTLAAVVALEFSGILVMLCAVSYCSGSYCCCVVGVVVVVIFFLFLYCFSALGIEYFAMTNVTFSALFVGFCIPLCRVM